MPRKGFFSARIWMMEGSADDGEGGSVRRYRERIEERTPDEDWEAAWKLSIETMGKVWKVCDRRP